MKPFTVLSLLSCLLACSLSVPASAARQLLDDDEGEQIYNTTTQHCINWCCSVSDATVQLKRALYNYVLKLVTVVVGRLGRCKQLQKLDTLQILAQQLSLMFLLLCCCHCRSPHGPKHQQ